MVKKKNYDLRPFSSDIQNTGVVFPNKKNKSSGRVIINYFNLFFII